MVVCRNAGARGGFVSKSGGRSYRAVVSGCVAGTGRGGAGVHGKESASGARGLFSILSCAFYSIKALPLRCVDR